jgi:tetratricopeptide (TPR) repeat protein
MPTQSLHEKLLPGARERRDLDIEIGFFEGLAARDPHDIEILQILGDDYTRRGRFEDGLRIDRQIIALRPGDALAHYNLACSLSLTGRLDEGILALNHAVELGYDDAEWLLSDRDIERLWEHPKFPQLLGRIRKLAKSSR